MSAPVKKPGIVVGVDGSPASNVAVYRAGQEAAIRNLPLTLVYVVNPVVPTWPQAPVPVEFEQWQKERAPVHRRCRQDRGGERQERWPRRDQ